jgi:sedoheptulokinase
MYLGIDIGTTKVAAAVADAERRLRAVESRPHGADIPSPPGRAEQNAAALLDAAWAAVRALPPDLRREVRAVGVTGQMHGVVLLDEAGEAIGPLITWQDGRCLEGGFLEDLSARTGYALRTGFGCATLAWLKRHGVLPPQTAAASTIHDLAAARLCGRARPVTDPTDAASWGLFDLQDLFWDADAVAAAGVDLAILPPLCACGSRAGEVTPQMAARLGLSAGVPVAAAIGDNQASLLATLAEPEKEVALTLGTGGQVSVVLAADAAIDWHERPATFEYRPYPGGRYAVVAASLCGGAAWAWLAEAAGSWMSDLGAAAPTREEMFAKLNALGLAAEEGLVVQPHFLGERYAPHLRGAIEGLDLRNFRLGNVARGLAQGILVNLREMLPAWALAGRTRLVGSGNALRRNLLLQRMAAETFGLPLVLTEGREEAALGAAILAAAMA